MKTILFKILIIFILFSFSFEEKKQAFIKDNNINTIEGFLIYRMQKKDAEFKKHNEKLKAEGKSYSIMIDYELETFFIPMDSLISQSLGNLLINNNKQCGNEIYQTDINRNKGDISYYCDKNFKFKSNIPVYCSSSLEELKGDSEYLYRIKYLKGNFKYCQIENTKMHRRFMNIRCLPNSKLENLNCYFLIAIDSMNCDTDINGFELWE